MTIEPIAYFRSPFTSKFGIPRQSGLVDGIRGEIVFEPHFRQPEALRGLEDFDYLWLIWGFSEHVAAPKHPTVRPPRLGGNRQMGVWATRSPFRPNNLGLSSVRIVKVDAGRMVIEVAGADLMDGTPVYDIKPYVEYADSHSGVRSGFTDDTGWASLRVEMGAVQADMLSAGELESLKQVLELDPRPHYHDDPGRVYGMPFGGWDVRFKVAGDVLTVTEMVKL
jgi:tRNA-Thr(GGU) m(6)t(6)A37 methyltransferase TsaA